MLPDKTEKNFFKLFKLLSEFPNFTPPSNVTSDFETACLNALLTVWPNVNLFLCWFHYAHNLWENVQFKNLAKDYVKDELVRNLFKYLKFLPFVPPRDVIKAFKMIQDLGENCQKFKPMFVYFEKIYIWKLLNNNLTVRKIPVYPI